MISTLKSNSYASRIMLRVSIAQQNNKYILRNYGVAIFDERQRKQYRGQINLKTWWHCGASETLSADRFERGKQDDHRT